VGLLVLDGNSRFHFLRGMILVDQSIRRKLMTLRRLKELLEHARHMARVRPPGLDREVAEAFVELAERIIDDTDDTVI
jgi:hypothetical protein